MKQHLKQKSEMAIFAAGCFWGVEEAFRVLPGVLKTRVGYIGGHMKHPTYKDVCSDTTGHAEAVEVTFDPTKTSFTKLLEEFFKNIHDPTTVNRQGPDIGSQYRSAIFYRDAVQKKSAEDVKISLTRAGKYGDRPIVTEITKAAEFYPAEDYHQKYIFKSNAAARRV